MWLTLAWKTPLGQWRNQQCRCPGDCSPRQQPVQTSRRISRSTLWITEPLQDCWQRLCCQSKPRTGAFWLHCHSAVQVHSRTILHSHSWKTILWDLFIINSLPPPLLPHLQRVRAPTLSRRSDWLCAANQDPPGLMDVLLLHRRHKALFVDLQPSDANETRFGTVWLFSDRVTRLFFFFRFLLNNKQWSPLTDESQKKWRPS